MTRQATVVEADGVDVGPGSVRCGPALLDELDVDVGDAVAVSGDRRSVASVGAALPSLDEGTVVLGEDVRRSTGAADGDVVTVDAVGVVPAESVRLAPTRALQFEGGSDAIARILRDRYVTTGDRVRAKLLDGRIAVTFVVESVTPGDPAVVTDATSITVASDAVEDGGPADRLRPASTDAVGGLDPEWSELTRLVGVPLTDPDVYRSIGGRPPNGVLVYGPSGAGKTLLVRALAGATGATLRRVTEEDLADRASVGRLVREARGQAPALLLVESLDSVAPAPDGGRSGSGDPRLVAALLDALADDEDVIVVGETDRIDGVDRSVRRGGRFDREVHVDVPTPGEREAILRVHARDLRLADDVDLTTIADRTHGYVGADLAALVTEATSRAIARLPVDPGADRPIPDEFASGQSVSAADFEAAMDAVGPSALRGIRVERPDVTYRDIGGLDWAKREVVRAVEWPVRFPEVFERLAADPPTGVLLYGPPGTGKTMLAKAVANSTDANFVGVDGPELLDKYVGESERGVREVFERARETAPTVVFFDEIDALAPERGSGGDTGAVERVVSQLLTELDGLEGRDDVVVIAATNRPDMVDRALLRPGRIEKTVRVPLPDRDAREAILSVHLDGTPVGDVDLAPLVAETEGYTGSDLAAIVREAGLLATEEYLKATDYEPSEATLEDLRVEQSHLERAVDAVRPSVSEEMRNRYAEIAREFSGRGGRRTESD